MSRLVEDICPYCYACANCHRYLANRSCGGCNDGAKKEGKHGGSNGISLGKEDGEGNNNDDLSTNGSNDGKDITNLGRGLESVDLNPPELALTKEDKKKELTLLEAAAHIKMARAQRELSQVWPQSQHGI